MVTFFHLWGVGGVFYFCCLSEEVRNLGLWVFGFEEALIGSELVY